MRLIILEARQRGYVISIAIKLPLSKRGKECNCIISGNELMIKRDMLAFSCREQNSGQDRGQLDWKCKYKRKGDSEKVTPSAVCIKRLRKSEARRNLEKPSPNVHSFLVGVSHTLPGS